MKLITSVAPSLRHVLAYGRWFTPSVFVLLIGLEVFGRRATSDVHDTFGALVLMLIVAGIAFRHRVNPIPWVRTLGAGARAAWRFFERFKLEFGPDLRGTPPLRRQLPGLFHTVALLLIAWCGLAALAWWNSESGWRPFVVPVTYIGYLTLMSVLWTLMFVASLGGVYFPILLLNRLSRRRRSESRMSRGQLLFLAGYLALTTAGAWLLPLWPMLAFAGLFWIGSLVASLKPSRPGAVQLIWRNPKSRVVRAITLLRLWFALSTLAVLLLAALMLSAAGGSVFELPETDNAMPLTTVMGNWLGWLVPGILLSSAAFVYLSWRNDPSRPVPLMADVADVPEANRRELARIARQRGWTLTFDDPDPDAVRLRLVAPGKSEAREFDPEWPLAVGYIDFAERHLFDRMERRREIQLRRKLTRGLERLLDEAKSQKTPGGCGYWFAPHLWFVAGMTRDEVIRGDDEPSFLTEIIGSPYVDVFSPAVRQYVHRLLRGLQVDLLFIEDGVNYRKFVRVLRVLFEVHDKSAGKRRVEDVHFRGLTKIRVLFHDFDVDEPFRSGNYPEPKFAPLGRLRILHVFRDRGDHEETSDQPFNFDSTPVPQFVGW